MAIRSTFSVDSVDVTNAAGGTKLVDRSMGRGSVLIANRGPNAIYIAPTSATATTADGFPIPAGDSVELDESNGEIWAIADTAAQVAPANTRVLVS